MVFDSNACAGVLRSSSGWPNWLSGLYQRKATAGPCQPLGHQKYFLKLCFIRCAGFAISIGLVGRCGMMSRAGSGKVLPQLQAPHRALSKYELAEGTAGGGSFSPSMGRVALGVTAETGDDLRSFADRVSTWIGRTSFVKNGCCPGGPEHWASHLIWCPAVKVRCRNSCETQRCTPAFLRTGCCRYTNWWGTFGKWHSN